MLKSAFLHGVDAYCDQHGFDFKSRQAMYCILEKWGADDFDPQAEQARMDEAVGKERQAFQAQSAAKIEETNRQARQQAYGFGSADERKAFMESQSQAIEAQNSLARAKQTGSSAGIVEATNRLAQAQAKVAPAKPATPPPATPAGLGAAVGMGEGAAPSATAAFGALGGAGAGSGQTPFAKSIKAPAPPTPPVPPVPPVPPGNEHNPSPKSGAPPSVNPFVGPPAETVRPPAPPGPPSWPALERQEGQAMTRNFLTRRLTFGEDASDRLPMMGRPKSTFNAPPAQRAAAGWSGNTASGKSALPSQFTSINAQSRRANG